MSIPFACARIIGCLGLGAVAASLLLPWFSVPRFVGGAEPATMIATHESAATWVFRGICLGIIVLSMVIRHRSRDWKRQCAMIFLILFVVLLYFPYCIAVWSPSIAGEASWLYSQHDDLMAGAGDIYTSQEYKDAFWRHRVALVNRPIDSQSHSLPDWGPGNFGWSRLVEMVEAFGLTAWFACFLGKGWVMAIIGAPAVICALCRDPRSSVALGAVLARRGLALFGLMLIVAATPLVVANWFVMLSRQTAGRGDGEGALRALRTAAVWMPSIRESGDFVVEIGLLENVLGYDTPFAQFYRANVSEAQGFKSQASEQYVAGLSSALAPALSRECAKALLRQAANALNSGELNRAIGLCETVLTSDPCNLKANYALQLAYLRRGDRDGLLRLQKRIDETYQTIDTPSKAAILANGSESVAFLEYQGRNPSAALEAWKNAKRH